jgi:hypothetical protein
MNKSAPLFVVSCGARLDFFCASVRLRQNAYTPQKLGLNFCLTLMLRLMGGNHALHYESICLGLPVGTPARVCLRAESETWMRWLRQAMAGAGSGAPAIVRSQTAQVSKPTKLQRARRARDD